MRRRKASKEIRVYDWTIERGRVYSSSTHTNIHKHDSITSFYYFFFFIFFLLSTIQNNNIKTIYL